MMRALALSFTAISLISIIMCSAVVVMVAVLKHSAAHHRPRAKSDAIDVETGAFLDLNTNDCLDHTHSAGADGHHCAAAPSDAIDIDGGH